MVFSILSPKKPLPEGVHEDAINYDDGPTKLYEIIEKREWKSAVIRSTKTPLEVATWIYRCEKGTTDKLRWKQLPLHAAIVFGGNEVVIHALLRSFPEAAEMSDDQGMLPLHLAFRHNANEEVIDMLLKIYPEGASVRDRKGRIPITLVRVAEEGKEATTLRAYMANFIFERSNVVVAEQRERQLKELTDTYTNEIKSLKEERKQENEMDYKKLLHLEDKLLNANKAFERWGTDVQPDKIDFHTRDYVSRDELHDSLCYSIERFAKKAELMEEDKARDIEQGLADITAKMKEMEVNHQAELDALTALLKGTEHEGIKVDAVSTEQQDKLDTVRTQLMDRLSEFDQQQQKLKEAEEAGASHAEQVLSLSTQVLTLEKKAQEERMDLEAKFSTLENTCSDLKSKIEHKDKEIDALLELEAENKNLQSKVEELLGTMCDVRRESQKENDIVRDDSEKNKEELKLAKEALAQASDTVHTLEDQMAKLYVEKEGLRSRYYSLQQTSAQTEETLEDTITRLETEAEQAKEIMKAQSEKITQLSGKFDGLTALREKEKEMARGREILLSAKVEHLTTKYESFQEEIDDYNNRSESFNRELDHYKETVAKLQRELAEERQHAENMEEKARAAKESEVFHVGRVQDLAENLARVSMDRKRMVDEFEKERQTIKQDFQLVNGDSMKRVEELQSIMNDTEKSLEKLNRRCRELENENESLRNSLEEMAKKMVRSAMEQRNGIASTISTN